ncbi:MAG TPA: hypothetical protein VE974_23365 [Thermoanaerobaculia bacterium]|nr:hypothetical protein [Thermoanaerobaculia bacterium]
MRVWALDRLLPPENAAWNSLNDYLNQTRACLSGDDRKKYLGEVSLVAEQRAADCEAALSR